MIVGGTLQGTEIKHGVNIYKGRKRIMEKIVLINWETGVHGKGGNMGRDKSKDFLNSNLKNFYCRRSLSVSMYTPAYFLYSTFPGFKSQRNQKKDNVII